MDRRTHHRLAQPLPPLGQGLGVPQPKGLGVLAPRLNPPHAEKALSKKSMIPDRLLEWLRPGRHPSAYRGYRAFIDFDRTRPAAPMRSASRSLSAEAPLGWKS